MSAVAAMVTADPPASGAISGDLLDECSSARPRGLRLRLRIDLDTRSAVRQQPVAGEIGLGWHA